MKKESARVMNLETTEPLRIFTTLAVKWDWEFLDRSRDSEWFRANRSRRPLIRDRLWGFFRDFETAERAVRENWGSNFDEAGYYNGAIIEEVQEGYAHFNREHRWFYRHRADYKHGDIHLLERMPEPEWYRNRVALTLG